MTMQLRHVLHFNTYKINPICSVCSDSLQGCFRQGLLCDVCHQSYHVQCAKTMEDVCPVLLAPSNNNNNNSQFANNMPPQSYNNHNSNANQNPSPFPVIVNRQDAMEILNMDGPEIEDAPFYYVPDPKMDSAARRKKIQQILKQEEEGAWILRFSDREKNYIISILFEGHVRHVVISSEKDGNENRTVFSVKSTLRFHSIPQLLVYYQAHALSNTVSTCLKKPITTKQNAPRHSQY